MTPVEQTARRPLPEALAQRLEARFGQRASRAQSIRAHHGHDESHFPDAAPDAVVFVRSTEEVADLVRACAEFDVPVIPFGVGSSLEGHILATRGGVCIDFSEMNKVLDIRAEDMLVVVQPGVTRKQLNAELHGSGLFFPIDPGADASLGGMAATRADIDASGLIAPIVGHVGDGNLHAIILVAPKNETENAQAEALNRWISCARSSRPWTRTTCSIRGRWFPACDPGSRPRGIH